MIYTVKSTKEFDKNIDLCAKRGRDISLLYKIVDMLAVGKQLPAKYNAHKLKGKYKDLWECHIQPDWLLIWKQDKKNLILILTNTGTHSDLF